MRLRSGNALRHGIVMRCEVYRKPAATLLDKFYS